MTSFNGVALNESSRIGVDEPAVGLSRKLIVIYKSPVAASQGMHRFRDAWAVIGGLGRWCDDELGDWPSNEDCVLMLPEWLRDVVEALPDYEVDNWLSDLHDRNWVVWSVVQEEEKLFIVLACESMPISDWPLKLVLKSTGGTVGG
jgi:hypothetical protein